MAQTSHPQDPKNDPKNQQNQQNQANRNPNDPARPPVSQNQQNLVREAADTDPPAPIEDRHTIERDRVPGPEGIVDEPPGRDGHQGQNPEVQAQPVPHFEPGTNPPGTNPPVPPVNNPYTTPVPGSVPGQTPEEYAKNQQSPRNQGDEARRQETPTRGGPSSRTDKE